MAKRVLEMKTPFWTNAVNLALDLFWNIVLIIVAIGIIVRFNGM
jgi:hypothetical protein